MNLVLRWLGTAVSLLVSTGLATMVIGFDRYASRSLVDIMWTLASGTAEMMLYLLPLWAANVLVRVVPAATKWIRLICGAIGLGIGIAVVVGLAMARGAGAFLMTFAWIYVALGAYNCWLSSRRSTTEFQRA